ncbi:siderophore-interacting protein [Nocardioides insulae]|uniref:siderophore-interacting protein n=1 Tax=Nocardioides insulae TaxID=394734 RepID=UPI00040A341E|nr:siderophore-interacting protein [Nocardioides insulae]
MSTRAEQYAAEVVSREQLSPHLVRIVVSAPDFRGTGVPDEWVGLIVPGQFQSRYYTVRAHAGGLLTLDIVVHETGLVTEWAGRESIVGETITITAPKGSYTEPEGAGWVLLVGDLTALPAMARIAETSTLPVRVWAEVPDDTRDVARERYLPGVEVTWLPAPEEGGSALAAAVETIDWPGGDGYFWMAGESSQMRAIRKHLMRERRLPASAYDVMGYWRGGAVRQPRAVDPGPVWRAGKAAGKSDEQIWADYDQAVQEAQQ